MSDDAKNKKTPLRRAFGLKIKILRYELEMTQIQLAEKSDLHPTYIGSVERGERNISLDNIITLAKALECSSPKDLIPDWDEIKRASMLKEKRN